MHVAICSLVRNGMKYLPAYRKQLEALVLPEGTTWSLCILEGDSEDGSWEYLVRWASEDDRVIIGREDVGEPVKSEGMDGRAERWARAGNASFSLLEAVQEYSHVLWMESDLCFPLDTVSRLLAHEVDIVSPVIWIGGQFYDTWGFRDLEGRKWTNGAPYHPDYRINALMEMGSVGSCVLFRRAILDAGIRFRGPYETGLLVGMCNDARSKGFKVFADTATSILHPVSLWEDQLWAVSEIEITGTDQATTVVPRTEWPALQVNRHILSIEEEAVVRDQQAFFKNVFQKWQSNALEVTLELAPSPLRKYKMKVLVKKPTGVARIGMVWQAIMNRLRTMHLETYLRRDGIGLDKRRLFRFAALTCNVSVQKTK